jgi:6-phosphogluconolactonase
MLAYVGGYTSKDRNGRGNGINVYRVDEVSGAWAHVQRLGDLVNPSWLTLDRQRSVLYSAHGEEHDRARHWPDSRPQTSAHPHDVAFDPRGRFCLIPDKGLDAVFVFRVDEGGKLLPGATASVVSRPRWACASTPTPRCDRSSSQTSRVANNRDRSVLSSNPIPAA